MMPSLIKGYFKENKTPQSLTEGKSEFMVTYNYVFVY